MKMNDQFALVSLRGRVKQWMAMQPFDRFFPLCAKK